MGILSWSCNYVKINGVLQAFKETALVSGHAPARRASQDVKGVLAYHDTRVHSVFVVLVGLKVGQRRGQTCGVRHDLHVSH